MAKWTTLRTLLFWTAVALLVASPAAGWAVPGDPDEDTLPTLMETRFQAADPLVADSDGDGLLDGWETAITGTSPEDPDSDDNGTLDGFEDSDRGGVTDGAELANGSNPLDSSDDAKLTVTRLRSPVPEGPEFNALAFFYKVPPSIPFIWDMQEGVYFLQFDSTPAFAAPVSIRVSVTIGQTEALSFVENQVAKKWTLVTRKGPVVYWRVQRRDDSDDAGRRFSSEIMSFRLTGSVAPAAPESGAAIDPAGPRPTFSWNGKKFVGYRLVVTGNHKLGTGFVQIPSATTWQTAKAFTPSRKKWRQMTALGDTLTWWVVARDLRGRLAYSQPSALSLTGGPTPEEVSAPKELADPDTPPTFAASRGTQTRYRFYFSGNEDFKTPGFVYPAPPAWASYADATVGYTPSAADWNVISALGPTIFWKVTGTDANVTFYTQSPVFSYQPGPYLQVEREAATLDPAAPNPIPPALPTFTFSELAGAASPADGGYILRFGADKRLAGTLVVDPPDGTTTSPWTMPSDLVDDIAWLGTSFPWIAAEGRTAAGNSVFSAPYQLTSESFLTAPTLNELGTGVDKDVQYAVSWLPSALDDPAEILVYELQESTSRNFESVRSFLLTDTSRNFKHGEVSGTVSFFYRVRSLNSIGHSAWSRTDRKVVTGVLVPRRPLKYWSGGDGSQPFAEGGNTIILDEYNSNNRTKGTFARTGAGWCNPCGMEGSALLDPLHCGGGWKGGYYFIANDQYPTCPSNPGPNGKETALYTPNLKARGRYEVWVSWASTHNRANPTPFTVTHAAGQALYNVDETIDGNHTTWAHLGTFCFDAGSAGTVFMENGPSHSESVDAAGWKYLGECAD